MGSQMALHPQSGLRMSVIWLPMLHTRHFIRTYCLVWCQDKPVQSYANTVPTVRFQI